MISETLRRHVPGSFMTLWLRPAGGPCCGGGGGAAFDWRCAAEAEIRVAGIALRHDEGLVLPADGAGPAAASDVLKRPKPKRGLVGEAVGGGDGKGEGI